MMQIKISRDQRALFTLGLSWNNGFGKLFCAQEAPSQVKNHVLVNNRSHSDMTFVQESHGGGGWGDNLTIFTKRNKQFIREKYGRDLEKN